MSCIKECIKECIKKIGARIRLEEAFSQYAREKQQQKEAKDEENRSAPDRKSQTSQLKRHASTILREFAALDEAPKGVFTAKTGEVHYIANGSIITFALTGIITGTRDEVLSPASDFSTISCIDITDKNAGRPNVTMFEVNQSGVYWLGKEVTLYDIGSIHAILAYAETELYKSTPAN